MWKLDITSLLLASLACLAVARDLSVERSYRNTTSPTTESYGKSRWLTSSTKKFLVNGTAVPEVDWDLGESYAGLIPVTAANNSDSYYFWFFPSKNTLATDEIIIWLAGGPGCSGLMTLINENGPFTWQPGTVKPNNNAWSLQNLTNVLYIDQPAGTGFSQGNITLTNETELAARFLSWWKNFSKTFKMQNFKIYLAGESYSGKYVPYVADALFSANDTTYYNIRGTMMNDALIAHNDLQLFIPIVPFTNAWNHLWNLNSTFMSEANAVAASKSCNYTTYMNEWLAYPAPQHTPKTTYGSCEFIGSAIVAAIQAKNPCLDLLQITNYCPLQYDVVTPPLYPGYPRYRSTGGPRYYFNRHDVKKAINAPLIRWEECTNINVFVDGFDRSPPPYHSVYPRVIERSDRTVLAHGRLDMALIANGTLMVIQQMKWNGTRGFAEKPSKPFVVPERAGVDVHNLAGSGVFGTTHTEKGLTWIEVDLAGHMLPQYAPSAAYRYTEYLLGRIEEGDLSVG